MTDSIFVTVYWKLQVECRRFTSHNRIVYQNSRYDCAIGVLYGLGGGGRGRSERVWAVLTWYFLINGVIRMLGWSTVNDLRQLY